MIFKAKFCIYIAEGLRGIAADCRDKYFDVTARFKERKNPPLIASGNAFCQYFRMSFSVLVSLIGEI